MSSDTSFIPTSKLSIAATGELEVSAPSAFCRMIK